MEDFKWNWPKEPQPITDDFKWNWAEAAVPQYKSTGPGVGSLLMAMNPETRELGINMMNQALAQDRANRAELDKQGQEAVNFVNDLDKVAYERELNKQRIIDQQKGRALQELGHQNAATQGLINAYANGNPYLIATAEKTAKANGLSDEFIEGVKNQYASDTADAKTKQDNFIALMLRPEFNSKFTTKKEKDAAIDILTEAINNGEIDAAKGYAEIENIRKGRTIGSEISESNIKAKAAAKTAEQIAQEKLAAKEAWINEWLKQNPGKTKYLAEQRWAQTHKE